MVQKFEIWFDELIKLSPEDANQEIKILKMEIYTLELRLFSHELIKHIKEKNKLLHKTMLENYELHHNLEIGI